MVTEDNLVNQKVAVGMLNRLGYRPDMAMNGTEALKLLKQKDYDVILMDMEMPEMEDEEQDSAFPDSSAMEEF